MSVPNRSIRDRKIPAHIAIILDGNGRWAIDKGLQRTADMRAAFW